MTPRVAVDHAVAAERQPPGGEHRGADPVAHGERGFLVLEQLAPFEPIERQQSVGRQLRPHLRHPNLLDAVEHLAIKHDVLGFAAIIELLANAHADFLGDLAGVDHGIHASMDREDQLQLPQVSFDRRLHVRVLQLAGKITPAMGAGAMNLAERSSRGRVMLEARELLLPARAELRAHTALDEGPAHGRRLALQLHQLGCVFRRQRVRDGGHELGHLHDRPLEAAERGGELHRVPAAVERQAEQPRAGNARGHAAHIGAYARIAGGTGGETVGFTVGHAVRAGKPHSRCNIGVIRGSARA